MKIKTLNDVNVSGKIVLLRSDLNSDVQNNKIVPSERIKKSVKTIKELKNKKAKVVIIAHQGRPGKKDFVSLRQQAKILSRYTKIKFIQDICGKKALDAIKNLKEGEAILLENIRGIKDEFKPEKGKENRLYSLVNVCDIYVNDAFSVCHRKESSIVLFPKYLESYAGRLLEEEITSIEKVRKVKYLCILGGAKPEDNIKLLGKNKVLATGLFGQICTIAKGKDLGGQNKYLKKTVKDYDGTLRKLKRKLKNVKTPLDFAVSINGKRKELQLNEFPNEYEIFDIGERTIKDYLREIKKAKAIYVKGPSGFSADKKFAKGTIILLKAISKSKAFTLVGGGHLTDTINKYKITGFDHTSLSGGALLRYLSGEKLPGLKVLERK